MRSKRKSTKTRGSSKRNRFAGNLVVLATMRRLIDRRERELLETLGGRTVAFDENEGDCPDLSDSSQPAEIYLCQLLARGRYELGETTCEEYVEEHNACISSS